MIIKKLTATLIGICLLSSLAGQDLKRFGCQFDFGTTLMIPYKRTISQWPEVENHPQTDYRINSGYFIESLLVFQINEKYYIKSGINYNYNRLKFRDRYGFTTDKGNIHSSNITLPALVEYKLNKHLSFSAGINYSFLLKIKEKGVSYLDITKLTYVNPGYIEDDPAIPDLDNTTIEYSENLKRYYNKTGLDLLAQADYEFNLSRKLSGILFTRFNYGLTRAYKKEVERKWKNYILMFGFGIKL